VKSRPLSQALAFYGWLVLVAAIFDLGVYKLDVTRWEQVGPQVCAYALTLAPVLAWSPRTLRTLRMPPRQAIAGAVLAAAAVGYAALALGRGLSLTPYGQQSRVILH
jgi:hypothetical protein